MERHRLIVFDKQNELLVSLIENTNNKSENQIKTLTQTILPRIALYKTLASSGYSDKDAYDFVRKYMIEVVAAKKKPFYVENGESTLLLFNLQ